MKKYKTLNDYDWTQSPEVINSVLSGEAVFSVMINAHENSFFIYEQDTPHILGRWIRTSCVVSTRMRAYFSLIKEIAVRREKSEVLDVLDRCDEF